MRKKMDRGDIAFWMFFIQAISIIGALCVFSTISKLVVVIVVALLTVMAIIACFIEMNEAVLEEMNEEEDM